MTTGWLFLFVCAAFACHGQPPKSGDGKYYETKGACYGAARGHASRIPIRRGHWEAVCVERERTRL